MVGDLFQLCVHSISGITLVSLVKIKQLNRKKQDITNLSDKNEKTVYKNDPNKLAFGEPIHAPRRTPKCVKAYGMMRQSVLLNTPRRIRQKVKEFFKNLFIVLKKLCQVFRDVFYRI